MSQMKTSASMAMIRPVTEKEESDFGTYHYSTAKDSAKARKKAKTLFTKAFDGLPFSRDDKLKILDVGCGLGFLSCVCAEFYPNSSVTGFDTFEHASLKDSSIGMARRNARILGFSDRIVFQKGDIFLSDFRSKKFDLLVSSLVSTILGRKDSTHMKGWHTGRRPSLLWYWEIFSLIMRQTSGASRVFLVALSGYLAPPWDRRTKFWCFQTQKCRLRAGRYRICTYFGNFQNP